MNSTKYLPRIEREFMRMVLNALKRKHFCPDYDLTIEDVGIIIDAVHASGYFFVKRITIEQFNHYCEKTHKALLESLR